MRVIELKMLKSLLALCLFSIIACSSTTGKANDQKGHSCYYISNNGSDRANGKTPQTAWRSVSKVNTHQFLPGDSILFERGGTWRETLEIPSSGDSLGKIVFGAYGSGSSPRLLGSEQIGKWEQVDGRPNIWRSGTVVPNPHDVWMSEIWFIEQNGSVSWGKHHQKGNDWIINDKSVLDFLSQEYNTTWVGFEKNAGYIYVYSPEDPGKRYLAVEVPVRESIINLKNREWISIDGLTLEFCLNTHINEDYQPSVYLRGLDVTRCVIAYSGVKDGSNMFGIENRHSQAYIGYNEIHDCGRRNISLVMYDTEPVTCQEDVVIEHNHLYNGYHTSGVDINNIGQHTIRNIIIRYNIIEGNPEAILDDENTVGVVEGDPRSMGIFIANQGSGSSDVGRIKVYGNIFRYMTSRAVAVESAHDVEIYNNTFFHFNSTLSGVRAFIYAGENGTGFQLSNIVIRNNIFVEDIPQANKQGLSCIKLDYEDRDQFIIDHNLYYAPDPQDRLMRVNNGRHHYAIYQWKMYQQDLGFDLHSPRPSDPQFTNPPEDLSLKISSPARNAGTEVSFMPVDLHGTPLDSVPDLGAVQYWVEQEK